MPQLPSSARNIIGEQIVRPYWRQVYDRNQNLIIGLLACAAFLILVYIIAVAKLIKFVSTFFILHVVL